MNKNITTAKPTQPRYMYSYNFLSPFVVLERLPEFSFSKFHHSRSHNSVQKASAVFPQRGQGAPLYGLR